MKCLVHILCENSVRGTKFQIVFMHSVKDEIHVWVLDFLLFLYLIWYVCIHSDMLSFFCRWKQN